jgi:hypothetical protein
LQRLLSETEQGRAQSTAELRNDIRILTRTVAALAEAPQGSGACPQISAGVATTG